MVEAGTVGLNVDDNNLSLTFPDDLAKADVLLTNGTEVNVRAGGGGSIAINSRNLDVKGGSQVRAGIESGMGSPKSYAGDIEINATGVITVADEQSLIANAVLAGAIGKGGNVNIITGSLFAINGGQVNALTLGQGDAGSVTINARETISLDGVASNGNSSGFYNAVAFEAEGNAGGIEITTGSLSLTNGAMINASIFGQGNGGSVTINARETVSLDGVAGNGNSSGLFNMAASGAEGNSGSISVRAKSITSSENALITSAGSGTGNNGSIFLEADGLVSLVDSRIASNKSFASEGNSGDITIQAGSLILTNTFLEASSQAYAGKGRGNAGDISLLVNGAATLSDGSTVDASVNMGSTGNAGDIIIQAGSLFLKDSFVDSTTDTGGTAGSIFMRVDDSVSLSNTRILSANFNDFPEGGLVGNIEIKAGSLLLSADSEINASSVGRENGGESNAGLVSIQVDGSVIQLVAGFLKSDPQY